MGQDEECQRVFLEELTNLPEGGILMIGIADQSRANYAISLSRDTLANYSRIVNQMGPDVSSCVVSMLMRPGSSLFWTILEHMWFSPIGPNEHLYQCAWARWQDQIWVIGIIPASLAWTFDEAARLTGMRVSKGAPMIIDGSGVHAFPIRDARALENGNPNDPHYKASAESLALLMEGKIKPDEVIRRINEAERGMFNKEFEEIKRFHHEYGIKDNPEAN